MLAIGQKPTIAYRWMKVGLDPTPASTPSSDQRSFLIWLFTGAMVTRLGALGAEVCHRLSSPACTPTRHAMQNDNATANGVFIDASTVMLTLYVIANSRGSARQLADGLDGERKST